MKVTEKLSIIVWNMSNFKYQYTIYQMSRSLSSVQNNHWEHMGADMLFPVKSLNVWNESNSQLSPIKVM